MADHASRPLKNRRKYGKLPALSTLVACLNGDPVQGMRSSSPASRRRVIDFIANAREALEAIDEAPSWDLINNPTRRMRRLMVELNARLDEYPTSVFFYINYGREWVFDPGALAGGRPVIESMAVHNVIELAKLGTLARLMTCGCGRWFFAKFAHQKFCSTRCRKKNHESSEEFKAARRAYMRRYYHLKVSGRVK
jgi:hypothetical protein